jgi:membrane protein involved in colicin uptake
MPDATPEQLAAFRRLRELSLGATVELEGQLTEQKKADAIAKKQREEEARMRLEQQRLISEQEEKNHLENLRKLDEEQAALEAAERDLAAKKKALQDAQRDAAKKAPQDVQGEAEEEKGDEDEDEDNRSESPVSHDIRPPHFILTAHNFIRGLPRRRAPAASCHRSLIRP